MTDETLLVIQDNSGDPEKQEMLMDWVEGFEDDPPWDKYDIMVTGPDMAVAEVPALDALADAVAERVAAKLSEEATDE